MDFELKASTLNSWQVIAARGELDLFTVALLQDELKPVLEAGSPLIFDFSELKYLDSAAIGVVVGAFKKLSKLGSCVRVACSEPVRRIFETAGLGQMIGLYDSLQAAAKTDQTDPQIPG